MGQDLAQQRLTGPGEVDEVHRTTRGDTRSPMSVISSVACSGRSAATARSTSLSVRAVPCACEPNSSARRNSEFRRNTPCTCASRVGPLGSRVAPDEGPLDEGGFDALMAGNFAGCRVPGSLRSPGLE